MEKNTIEKTTIEKILNLIDLHGNGVVTITEMLFQIHSTFVLNIDQKNWSAEYELINTFIKSKMAELDRLYDAEHTH